MAEVTLQAADRVARAPGALAERVGADVLVLDPAQDRYVRLNGTGGWVFEALGNGTTVGELAARFGEAHGLAPERALADVRAFLGDLARRGLVTAAPEAS